MLLPLMVLPLNIIRALIFSKNNKFVSDSNISTRNLPGIKSDNAFSFGFEKIRKAHHPV